jgi:hypothetical protein
MTNLLSVSSRLYRRLVALYPEDLRRDFADEMMLVFADDLAAARREAGLRGVLRVWRCCIGEFLRFALPGHASNPALRVPAIAVAFGFASLGAEVVLHCATHQPARFGAAGLLATFAPMFVPLAVIWGCRGRAFLSLGLSANKEKQRA